MLRFRLPLAVVSLAFASCSGSVTFRSPVDWSMDVGAYYGSNFHGVQNLVTSNDLIAKIACPGPGTDGDEACEDSAMIPASGAGSDIELRCNEENLCDPEPYRFVEDLGLQDLRELAEPKISIVDSVSLREVELTIHTNSTNVDLPQFEVRWGPVSSTVNSAASATHVLASVPAITKGETGPIVVTLDRNGFEELQEHITNVSTEVRFFLATTYDAEPDVGIPNGLVDVTVGLIIRASGELR